MLATKRDTVRDLERIRYVTAHYEQLQGLKHLPLGLIALALAALPYFPSGKIRELPTYFEESPTLEGVLATISIIFFLQLLPIAALVLALVAYARIGDYYERKFGRIQRTSFGLRRNFLQILAITLFIVACFLAIGVDTYDHPPLPLSWLVLGIGLIALGLPERRFRMHCLIMGMLIVGLSFLPLLGVLPREVAQEPTLLPAFVGVFQIVGGIFDHLLLVRTMKRLPEEDRGETI